VTTPFRILVALAAVAWTVPLGAANEVDQYRYDTAGRLIEVRTATRLTTYTYDAAGTVIGRTVGANNLLFADGFEELPP
jgi:YD repeat-containing protein